MPPAPPEPLLADPPPEAFPLLKPLFDPFATAPHPAPPPLEVMVVILASAIDESFPFLPWTEEGEAVAPVPPAPPLPTVIV